MKNITLLSVMACSMIGLSLPAYSASEMFMKLDGINGESTKPGHEGEIDVLAWSWGMSQPGAKITASDRAGGAKQPGVGSITITKYVDSTTQQIFSQCCDGQHFPTAKLTVRRAGEPLEYVVLEMSNLVINSISTAGSGVEDRLTENVTLNFGAIKSTYTPLNQDGSQGDTILYEWKTK